MKEDDFKNISEQFTKIEDEIKEHENNIRASNTSPFDRKMDIIDINRSFNTKSISGKIYNILIESGFDKDFNAHEKKNNQNFENRKKEEIIKTSGRIWKLTIPNYYKDKLITMNLSGFKVFKVLYKLGYIQQLTCYFCSGELLQSHITFDCTVACFYWSLFKLSFEKTIKKSIDIRYHNVFNLKLEASQGVNLTVDERNIFLNMVGMLKVNLHNMYYYTLFNFSRYSDTPVRYYNSLIKRVNETEKFTTRFKPIRSFPARFPVSGDKFDTLNKHLSVDEIKHNAIYDIKKLEMDIIKSTDKDWELYKSIYENDELVNHDF